MKRSELIEIIKETIENNYGSDTRANVVLDKMLELGCLPPSRKLDYSDAEALRRVSSPVDTFKYYHSFDKEDETPVAVAFDPDDIPF